MDIKNKIMPSKQFINNLFIFILIMFFTLLLWEIINKLDDTSFMSIANNALVITWNIIPVVLIVGITLMSAIIIIIKFKMIGHDIIKED